MRDGQTEFSKLVHFTLEVAFDDDFLKVKDVRSPVIATCSLPSLRTAPHRAGAPPPLTVVVETDIVRKVKVRIASCRTLTGFPAQAGLRTA